MRPRPLPATAVNSPLRKALSRKIASIAGRDVPSAMACSVSSVKVPYLGSSPRSPRSPGAAVVDFTAHVIKPEPPRGEDAASKKFAERSHDDAAEEAVAMRHTEPLEIAAGHRSNGDSNAEGAGATMKSVDVLHTIVNVSDADGAEGSVIEKGDTTAAQAATAKTGTDDGTEFGNTAKPAAVSGHSTRMRGIAHPSGRERQENGGDVFVAEGV